MMKEISEFTKEELKKFPPLPSFMQKELEPDGDPQNHHDLYLWDFYWIGKEDGSEGEWRICPDMW